MKLKKSFFLAAITIATWIPYLPAAETAFHDIPSGPRALKGDVLPPFGMVDEDGTFHPTPHEVPAGFDVGPNRPPESVAIGPSLKIATEAAEVAMATCRKAGYRIGVAVIDSVGQPIVLLNEDGTDGSHGFVAMRKAEAALILGMPSSKANELAQQDKSLLNKVTPSMLLDGGAVPIISNGEIIGAIGSSGAADKKIGAKDEECAKSGLKVFEKELAQ